MIPATDKSHWDRIIVCLRDRQGSSTIATIKWKLLVQQLQRSQRSQRSYRNQSTGIATIATIVKIAEIMRVLRSQRSQWFYGNQSSAIVMIAVILTIVTIVNDHMEIESGLFFGNWGTEKFHYVFTFRFRDYFLGANVPPEIISLDALEEMEIFAKIYFIKQGKLLSMIPQIKIGHTLPFGDQSLKTWKIITHCLKL